MGRIMRFSCSKLFLFLSMYFYSFIAQVVVDGLAGTVVTKLELRVGFIGLVAILETESETTAKTTTTSTSEDFPYHDLSLVNLSILSTCLVNSDSVCGDCPYRSFLFFSFLSTIS